MRMAAPDVVLFIVGALLFSGASYAIVQQGGLEALRQETSALGVFEVAFQRDQHEVGAAEVDNMLSANPSFELNNTDVYEVLVTVACSPGQSGQIAQTSLSITVAGPNGLAGEASGACGPEIAIPVNVTAVPADTSVGATTEAEARAAVPVDANSTRAVGTWTVTIAGEQSAGGQVPLPQPVQPPTGAVSITVKAWHPAFTAVQGR